MMGIVLGHGWHDDSQKVLVPEGMQLDFFTREDTPMLMSNLLALLRSGDLGIPMDSAVGGEEIHNYGYDAFTEDQYLRAAELSNVDSNTPVLFTPDATKLCADPANCPALGPHNCGGLFAYAAANNLTHIQLLSCRVDINNRQGPTRELMGDHGEPDTTVDDQFKTWIRSFLTLTTAEQDTAWEDLDHATQVHLADDGVMIEWAECYGARAEMRSADPAQAAAIVGRLTTAVQQRLFSDYPDYRHLLADVVQLSAAEQQWIDQDFLPQDFLTQIALWQSFTTDRQLRYLADEQVTSWAAAYRVWDYFQLAMEPEYLADMVRQLDDTNRARLRSQDDLVAYMGTFAPVLS